MWPSTGSSSRQRSIATRSQRSRASTSARSWARPVARLFFSKAARPMTRMSRSTWSGTLGHRLVERDAELRARVVQLDEHVAEILGKLDHLSRSGTNRQGVWRRPYAGRSRPARDQLSSVRRATRDSASAPCTRLEIPLDGLEPTPVQDGVFTANTRARFAIGTAHGRSILASSRRGSSGLTPGRGRPRRHSVHAPAGP